MFCKHMRHKKERREADLDERLTLNFLLVIMPSEREERKREQNAAILELVLLNLRPEIILV